MVAKYDGAVSLKRGRMNKTEPRIIRFRFKWT